MYGWCGVNNMTDDTVQINIQNLSGYMLGNARHMPASGGAWLSRDTLVYVCRTLDAAMRILESSQRGFVDRYNPVWTTIYHVTSPMIKCDRVERDMFWTHDATKIIVDAPVFHRAASKLADAVPAQNNAHDMMSPTVNMIQRTKGKIK